MLTEQADHKPPSKKHQYIYVSYFFILQPLGLFTEILSVLFLYFVGKFITFCVNHFTVRF